MSDTETPLHALILQHEEPTPPGLVTGWLDAHGAEVDVVRIDLDDREVDPSAYDLIVSLGSEFAAFDDHKPFVPREARLMQKARATTTSRCSGSASAARCWRGCWAARCSAATWPRSAGCPCGRPTPSSSRRVRGSSGTSTRSRRRPGATADRRDRRRRRRRSSAGRSLGLQFHPEVTPEIMDDWVREYRHELDAEGVDPDALLAETDRNAEENRRTALAAARALPRRGRAAAARPRPPRSIRTDGLEPCSTAPSTWPYPNIERGEGVWLTTTDGRRILDACSGGAMVACLGHGVAEIAAAAAEQAEQHLVLLQPPLHERAAGTAGRPPAGVRARDGAGAVRVRRVRGERDGAAARAAATTSSAATPTAGA